jgi:hypothetical protein
MRSGPRVSAVPRPSARERVPYGSLTVAENRSAYDTAEDKQSVRRPNASITSYTGSTIGTARPSGGLLCVMRSMRVDRGGRLSPGRAGADVRDDGIDDLVGELLH